MSEQKKYQLIVTDDNGEITDIMEGAYETFFRADGSHTTLIRRVQHVWLRDNYTIRISIKKENLKCIKNP